jgi:uncharacterized membrane protein (UPF0127 family)
MKEIKILLLAVSMIVFCLVLFFVNKKSINYPKPDWKSSEIIMGGETFKAEIVDNQEKIEKGLSGRESLCEKCAMLFLFDNLAKHNFWMKNMEFNLDLIWVKDNKIVQISPQISHELGEKETISPAVEVNKVIEINAGMSEKLGLKVGEEVR